MGYEVYAWDECGRPDLCGEYCSYDASCDFDDYLATKGFLAYVIDRSWSSRVVYDGVPRAVRYPRGVQADSGSGEVPGLV